MVNLSVRYVEPSLDRSGHAMETLLPVSLSHLTEQHWKFFSHWCMLNELESESAQRKDAKKNIWCQTPEERWVLGLVSQIPS